MPPGKSRLTQGAHKMHCNGSSIVGGFFFLPGPTLAGSKGINPTRLSQAHLICLCHKSCSQGENQPGTVPHPPPHLFTPWAPKLLLSSACAAGTSQLPEQWGGCGYEGEMGVARATCTWAGSMATLWSRLPWGSRKAGSGTGGCHCLLRSWLVLHTFVSVICTSSNSSAMALPPDSPHHHSYFLLPNAFISVSVFLIFFS